MLAKPRFVVQSMDMESNWAAEHLQVIRTLMERSALYRRALAPIMIFNGVVGLAAAALGWALKIGPPRSLSFLGWCRGGRRSGLVPACAPTGAQGIRALLVAAHASHHASVATALDGRLMVSVVAWARAGSVPESGGNLAGMLWLPLSWVVLYGCAFHAAGFFMLEQIIRQTRPE